MKSSLFLAFAASALLAFTGSAGAQQPIVIKFSHVVAVDTPKGKGAEYFKKLAEERTKGRVKVEVYPNSQLYKDGEEMEALQLGSVQMLAPSVAKFGPLGAREFEVFDLPYIFDSFAELHKVTEGSVGKKLFKKLETKSITGLAFWDNGFKDFSANKALRLPGDVKGLKMRIQSSNVLDAEIRALGGLAAEDGVLRGIPGVADRRRRRHRERRSNFYTQKMHEVQKFLALTDHGVIEYAVVANAVLGRTAGGHPHGRWKAMKGCDQVRQRHRQERERDALEGVRKSGKTEIHDARARRSKRGLVHAMEPDRKKFGGRTPAKRRDDGRHCEPTRRWRRPRGAREGRRAMLR